MLARQTHSDTLSTEGTNSISVVMLDDARMSKRLRLRPNACGAEEPENETQRWPSKPQCSKMYPKTTRSLRGPNRKMG